LSTQHRRMEVSLNWSHTSLWSCV